MNLGSDLEPEGYGKVWCRKEWETEWGVKASGTMPPPRRQCMTSACYAGPQLRVKMGSFLLPLPEPHTDKVGACKKEGSTVPSWLSLEILVASAGCTKVRFLLLFISQVGTPKERRSRKFWGAAQSSTVRITSDLDSSFSLCSYLVPSGEKNEGENESVSSYFFLTYLLYIFLLTS